MSIWSKKWLKSSSRDASEHFPLVPLLLAIVCFLALFPSAFVNRGIYIDEAWIGEQAKALLDHGTIVTNLFRDYPPLNQPIVVYHKLLVWLGAASSAVFGWGLYALRLVSAVAGVVTLVLFYLHLSTVESRRVAVVATILLLWTPLFWEMMRIYRPEMLVTCLGFAGYVLLSRARSGNSILLVMVAGLLSGLSGSAHPAGLAFVAAGFVALLYAKLYKYSLLFLAASIIGFFPYVSGLVTDRELFLSQLFHNDTMSSMVRISWWSPLVNLLEEHKRIFRQPVVIGISVMFVLSLLATKKAEFKQHRFFWVYLTTLVVCGAMLPFPKITRYMLPLTPFFAIASARAIDRLLTDRGSISRIVRIVCAVWLAVFIGYGGFALGTAALKDRQAPLEIAIHRAFAEKMVTGSLVMAPPKFIFPEVDSFVIQSYWGARVAGDNKRTIHQLEEYAIRHDVRYLLVDSEIMRDWDFALPESSGRFEQYRLIKSVPGQKYYLLEKTDSAERSAVSRTIMSR